MGHLGPFVSHTKTRAGDVGQTEPLGVFRWSIEDQTGSQRPHKKPIWFQRAPILGPR